MAQLALDIEKEEVHTVCVCVSFKDETKGILDGVGLKRRYSLDETEYTHSLNGWIVLSSEAEKKDAFCKKHAI